MKRILVPEINGWGDAGFVPRPYHREARLRQVTGALHAARTDLPRSRLAPHPVTGKFRPQRDSMAIKDRITGLFRLGRGSIKKPELALEHMQPTPPPNPVLEEERKELIRNVGDGFSSVGKVLERLDRHLETGTRSLEGMIQTQNRLPALMEEQRHLVEKTGALAEITGTLAENQRKALDLLTVHLQERDRTALAMVDRLDEIGKGLRELRDQDNSRMQLLLQFQRSGRRMALVLGAVALFVILALMTLIIVLSLRRDLLGLEPPRGTPPPAHSHQQPAGPAAPASPVETTTP